MEAPATDNGTRLRRLSGVALLIAIVVLLGWAIFTAVLVSQSGADEIQWTRLAWLFSSVEAIAFAAAGALFGSSVQRERAEKAEKAAGENAQDAQSGRTLAAVLKTDEDLATSEEPTFRTDEPDAAGTGATLARRHAALARELFP
jgi:hypothetical protein